MSDGTCAAHGVRHTPQDFAYDVYECPCGWFAWPPGTAGPQGPCPKCSTPFVWKGRTPVSVTACPECVPAGAPDDALPSYVEVPVEFGLAHVRRLARIARDHGETLALWPGAEFAFLDASQDDFQAVFGRVAGRDIYAEVQVDGPQKAIKSLGDVEVVWRPATWFADPTHQAVL